MSMCFKLILFTLETVKISTQPAAQGTCHGKGTSGLSSAELMEANTMNPEQSDLCPYCLQYRLPKKVSRR